MSAHAATHEMDIGALLAEQLDRVFDKHIARDTLDAAEHAFPAALWNKVEQLGITLALADADRGGSGLGLAEVEPALRALGRHAVPLPVGETMLAAWALSAAGIDVPPGPLAIATAPFDFTDDATLDGRDAGVAWVGSATPLAGVVLAARRRDEPMICLLDPAAGIFTSRHTIARLPMAQLQLDQARPVAAGTAPKSIGVLGLLPHLAALRAVQIGGALERVLALSIAYANDRIQFGKPIGKFQAIQHLVADLAGESAAAQVAGQLACRRIDRGDAAEAEFGAAVAKARAGVAATRGAANAHQIFGAIGVTAEHVLHHYTRRLWQWRDDGGNEHYWSERIGAGLLAAGGAALWPRLCANPHAVDIDATRHF